MNTEKFRLRSKMSALMTSMCAFRNVKPITRLLGCQADVFLHRKQRNICTQNQTYLKSVYLRRTFSKYQCFRCYTQTKQDDVKTLLQDVASKVATENKEKDGEDSSKSDQTEDKSDEKKEVKGPKIFGKQYTWTSVGFSVFGLWCSGALVMMITSWGKPLLDAEGNEIKDEYSDYPTMLAYMLRTYKEIFYQVKITQEPSRMKLLPDPLKYPYIQPKYTLVIELTDVLVHPDWTYGTGWRFKKRPGIDHFLRAVGPPLFEVVIYSKEQGMTADPIITKIDPENYIMYRLYRDATRYIEGTHVKDLSYLNRDLSRVIMIDWSKDAFKLNPENGFNVKRWEGEGKDTVLGELAEFLRAIAASNVDDVRPVLQYYSQFDDPMSKFRENQMKLKEEQERHALIKQEMTQKRTNFWKLK